MSDRRKLPPQTVRIEDAQAHLDALATRAQHGESFELTRAGRPVARLCPPDPMVERDQKSIDEAMRRLLSFEGMLGNTTIDEVIAWKNEGRM